MYPSVPHYLAACENSSIIDMESSQQCDADSEYSNNFLSDKIPESVYNQVGAPVDDGSGRIYQMNVEIPLESHEYCLVASAEGLTLLNEKRVNKQEKDDFYFMQRVTELAMDNCATFHVCKDKFLFISEIRKCPNIRVKGVSGIATASGIGTIRFTITSKTGENKEITL